MARVLSCILAALMTLTVYGLLVPAQSTYLAEMLTDRGPTPYFIVFFASWSLAILFLKWRKLALQCEALKYEVVPNSADFVLSAATVDDVLLQLYDIADDPRHFVLFNRIVVALSNLRNIGRVADVDDILRSQAEQDEAAMETSYSLVQGFVWAIPVLGFIGTVLGLSSAIGGFSQVLTAADDISSITTSLRGVTAGLSVAFETTLIALVAAVGKLKIMPYEQDVEA